ncbi:hypothetical protein [Streptomyces sp. NBC_01443]|uniref:hypothetical protein n=1 Tax=Streptomyces sp. NBC_01443 TaxID=2903868 RepID=UPI002258C29A|nr:hypothetical protein [Streptomyces sp. NBC_01443]MCX4632900.1 hypothetical protein [Streptomyces sp. NBC_01443]
MTTALPVNSFDEWSTLREVVVGRADHYNAHHVDTSFKLFYYDCQSSRTGSRKDRVAPAEAV